MQGFRYASTTNGCGGNIPAISRLGFPGFCLQDNGNAVRGTDGVNGGPSGISIGASWDKKLAYQRAQFLGAEFKAKGVSIALGPAVGAIGRVAEGEYRTVSCHRATARFVNVLNTCR